MPKKMDPSGHEVVLAGACLFVYEMAVFVGCVAWGMEVQKRYPEDKKTTMQHCAANCCIARLNLTMPVGWIPSICNDNPCWGEDAPEDTNANIRGYIAANRIDTTCERACCEELGFCKPSPYSGTPPVLPPYEPVNPWEAADALCAKACQAEVMVKFPGPSPEATDAFNACHKDCMRDAGFRR